MTVRELYNKLQELPLERFDDEVFIYIPDGDRYQVSNLDDSIEGVIELNAKNYETIIDSPYKLPGEDEVWNLLTDAMKPILNDYKDKLAKKKDNNHPSIH